MHPKVVALYRRWFRDEDHPYLILNRLVDCHVDAQTVVLEIGCGRTAPLLRGLAPRARRVIGLDVVPFEANLPVTVLSASADAVPLADESVDLIFSRSVLEHIEHPLRVFREWQRLLRPRGCAIFLTPNLWDYASIGSALIPSALHPVLVERLEGRPPEDTFPTFYRANTSFRIRKLAQEAGLSVEHLEHLGQYPSYLTFHPIPFTLGTGYSRLVGLNSLRQLRPWLLASLTKAA